MSAFGSFHGRTLATLHATGQPAKHEAFLPLPEGFSHVPYGDPAALRAIDPGSVAAVLLEPILGESGVVPPPRGYLAAARAICDELGLLLIVDEIQTGLGRTGRWFAFQHEGIVPDIVTIAKALGNGVPVGACWARGRGRRGRSDRGTTARPSVDSRSRWPRPGRRWRDSSRSTRPAIAVELGGRLETTLRRIDGVAAVRGSGFLLGVVLEDGIDSRAVFTEALRAGLVVNAPVPGVIRLMPPFVVSAEDCDEAAGLLAVAIARARAGGRKRGEEGSRS